VRLRSGEDLKSMPVGDVIERMQREADERVGPGAPAGHAEG
jgi:hypothetical protein